MRRPLPELQNLTPLLFGFHPLHLVFWMAGNDDYQPMTDADIAQRDWIVPEGLGPLGFEDEGEDEDDDTAWLMAKLLQDQAEAEAEGEEPSA